MSNNIDENIEQKIRYAACIVDVLTDGLGVELHRSGANYVGLCPFHEDKHVGSFVVSEAKNICTCFSCNKTWDPIGALMEGKQMKYVDALRWLAAKYNIYIDDQPKPKVEASKPRAKVADLPLIRWDIELAKRYLGNENKNPLIQWLYALPMDELDSKRLRMVLGLYLVGTSVAEDTNGWTIWWQVDDNMKVRTGKLMAYGDDGHRRKDLKYSFNFVHSMLLRAGRWSDKQFRVETCLFGLHLIDIFPNAEVCIVESEKSALICAAFTDPRERLWMATAGKSNLTRAKLQPLIDRGRYIVLYPDHDGFDEWKAAAKRIGYNKLSVSNKILTEWLPMDGEKADIADIVLRMLQGIEETEEEKIARRLGMDTIPDELRTLINNLNLKLEDE